MKKLIILIFLTALIHQASGYHFTISGTIVDNLNNPVVSQKVSIHSGWLQIPDIVFTDINGNYQIDYSIPGQYHPEFYVQSWAWCNNEYTNHLEQFTADNDTFYIEFQFCQQNNPPDFCIADFYIEKHNNHSFHFLSTSLGNIDSLHWNFGNGITSNEYYPYYHYPQNGLYLVCLTIYANGNCTNQKCKLQPVGPWENAFGNVEVNNHDLPNGKAFIYQITGSMDIVWTYSVDILDGSFYVPYLFYNDFFIQAIPEFDISEPHFPKYLPTYYNNSISWQNANAIHFSGPQTSINMELASYDYMYYGACGISGILQRFDTVPNTQGPSWLTDNMVPPVVVFLLDSTGTPLDFRYFEESGPFIFDNLPAGNYTLRTEKFRVEPHDIPIVLSDIAPNNSPVEILVKDSAIQIGIDEFDFYDSKISIFPNPAKEILKLQFENSGYYSIELIDLFGHNHLSISHSLFRTETINLSDLADGVYIIRITNQDGQIFMKKINKIH